jgi:transcriptional regulator with XRE-family HTH domain
MEALPDEDAAYLAAKTPLAFWRRYRNVAQQAVAEAVGVSQAHIPQIENGVREGSPVLLWDIAGVLAGSEWGPKTIRFAVTSSCFAVLLTHQAAHRRAPVRW